MVDPNANYVEYGMIFLPRHASPQTVASRKIEEDGLYRIVFQAQVVNNTAKWGKKIVVMVAATLSVDGTKVQIWTENIVPDRHYGMPIIVKEMPLKTGQTIEVKMRSDTSTKPYPWKSVFVLMAKNRLQFDVTRM